MAGDGKVVLLPGGYRGLLKGGKAAVDPSCCCCVPTDVLIVTCNANRITDDDYDVTLNGNRVGSVVHVGDSDSGCQSPGTGLWACSDNTIRPNSLTNAGRLSEGVCIADNQWTFGTINKAWLQANNQLQITITSNEGCGDWGLVSVWGVDAPNKRLCSPLALGEYSGYGDPPLVIADYNFPWKVAKPSQTQAAVAAPATAATTAGCCGGTPSLATRVASAAKAAASFAASGFQTVGRTEYQHRLAICDACDRKQGQVCLQCGCVLAVKAWGAVWHCPLGKW